MFKWLKNKIGRLFVTSSLVNDVERLSIKAPKPSYSQASIGVSVINQIESHSNNQITYISQVLVPEGFSVKKNYTGVEIRNGHMCAGIVANEVNDLDSAQAKASIKKVVVGIMKQQEDLIVADIIKRAKLVFNGA